MSRSRWVLLTAMALVAVVVAGGLAWALTGPRDGSNAPSAEAPSAESPPTDPGIDNRDKESRSTEELGNEFLTDWVDDGRVVRRDQGGDTVSEGQAYGMLIALGVGDEESFGAIWQWTSENLMRDDGLLAWRWEDGEVVDDEPASDADLDVARALVLAGDEFDRPELTEEGNKLADRILNRMTAQTDVGRILLPGSWAAATQPFAYNPSYASPAAFAILGESTGDPRWAELQVGSAAVTAALLEISDLPPDWAQVHVDGRVESMPGPAGTGDDVRYSYDAARLALRYAESCNAADVALAARLAEPLNRSEVLASELDLGGGALAEAVHPLSYGARAAAVSASGNKPAARDDLAEAVAVSDETPTYYGAAWVALAPLLLESDRLGGCPPLTEA